jgi:hypothetical protein
MSSGGGAGGAIAKVRYSHDAMIDVIIAQPGVSQGELARFFGYTEGWVSQVVTSDAFQARLAERKGELVDPTIVASVEERLRGLVELSAQVLTEKLALGRDGKLAARVLEITTKGLGYGARAPQGPIVNNFVVALPGKEEPKRWMEAYSPNGVQEAVLVEGGRVVGGG